MGHYVNPTHLTKEEWLTTYGTPVPREVGADWNKCPQDCLPVVLVDNGRFSAAGIAFDRDELACMDYREGDPRPRLFYYVPRQALQSVVPEIFNADLSISDECYRERAQ